MTFIIRSIRLTLILAILWAAVAQAGQDIPRLAKPPLGERWFIISKNNEKSGFNRLEIRENGSGYEMVVESGAKMSVFGFSREAISHERYMVNRDLSLRSFEVDEVINNEPLRLEGEIVAEGVKVNVTSDGKTKEKILKVRGAVYPPPALNIYPLMKGGEAGKSLHLKMLDIEKVKVIGVKISVVGPETAAGGVQSVHLQNDLYTFVDNDIWVDMNGATLKEVVSRANIVTQAEEAEAVKKFLSTRPWLVGK